MHRHSFTPESPWKHFFFCVTYTAPIHSLPLSGLVVGHAEMTWGQLCFCIPSTTLNTDMPCLKTGGHPIHKHGILLDKWHLERSHKDSDCMNREGRSSSAATGIYVERSELVNADDVVYIQRRMQVLLLVPCASAELQSPALCPSWHSGLNGTLGSTSDARIECQKSAWLEGPFDVHEPIANIHSGLAPTLIYILYKCSILNSFSSYLQV